jgi:hypothetical protein
VIPFLLFVLPYSLVAGYYGVEGRSYPTLKGEIQFELGKLIPLVTCVYAGLNSGNALLPFSAETSVFPSAV